MTTVHDKAASPEDASTPDQTSLSAPRDDNAAAQAGDANVRHDPVGAAMTDHSTAVADHVDWKAMSRMWEARSKANAHAAGDPTAIKATCADLRTRLAAAERDADEARWELIRHRIAMQHNLPADLVHGHDEDSMRSYAVRLAAWRVAQASPERR